MREIKAKNLTAQYNHKASGNPPGTLPISAISNCFPGLELDFRAIWKYLIEGIELHEAGLWDAGHVVLNVDRDGPAYAAGVRDFDLLISVNGEMVVAQGQMKGASLEFSNSLVDVFDFAGKKVPVQFESIDSGRIIEASLTIQPLFESGVLSEKLAEPGALTQGLCSPWQADYRECGCYYWAASRPDFVNASDAGLDGTNGTSWMQRRVIGDLGNLPNNRPDARPYPNTDIPNPDHYTYQELYLKWQEKLAFIIGGRDGE